MSGNKEELRDPLTHAIIGAAFRVRNAVGVGLLESPYHTFLGHELQKAGLCFEHEKAFPVMYDGIRVGHGFRPDFVVEDSVIVEIKTVVSFLPIHKAQLLTYLKLSGIHVGLLINFHAIPFKDGILRMVA